MTAEIEWIDELPERRKDEKKRILLAIVATPMRWCVLVRYKNLNSANAASWRLRRQNSGYEFAVRGSTIYARYVGEEGRS